MYQQESFGSAFKRGFMRIPPVIRTIIAINVIIFILQVVIGNIQIGGQSINRHFVQYLAFDPSLWKSITQPWRFVTYMFLHGGGFHLLFNMLWLWWMGRSVEESIGPRSFAVLFFGAGIGGAFFHIAFSFLYGTNLVIGASGAVFGVMVAFAYMFPRAPIMLIFLPPIEARFVVAGLIVFDVLFIGAGDGVARLVHLGGAGIGYLIIKAHYGGHDLSKYVRPLERLWKETPKKEKKRAKNKNMYSVSDVEVIDEKGGQEELDKILEKISREGYDGLTAEEKRKLFELSKRN
ncbi:MAG: rhomboid family intramembrane serine protease [Balneolaceae bacterium]|nr:MAG: rhomboid family intramembrane serine protease [Balneolaceae bacterium]